MLDASMGKRLLYINLNTNVYNFSFWCNLQDVKDEDSMLDCLVSLQVLDISGVFGMKENDFHGKHRKYFP